MRRRFFNLVSLLSLLMCIGSVVLWVTSYSRPFFIFYDWFVDGPSAEVRSVQWMSANGLAIFTADGTLADSKGLADEWRADQARRGFQRFGFTPPPPPRLPWEGFRLRTVWEPAGGRGQLEVWLRSIRAPYWSFAITFAILPVVWITSKRRRSRRAARERGGCCLNCGYDLRASPEKCPECGAPASVSK